MSTKIREIPAPPDQYWMLGIRAWRFDRENYRIVPIMWFPKSGEGPPVELGREMWEKLERMTSGD